MLKFLLILLRSENRLIDNPPIFNLTACRDFCDNKHGKLVDGDLFDELPVKIDDTHFESEFGVETCFYMNAKCSFFLNVKFNFKTKQWINGLTGTVFEGTKWFSQHSNMPKYPLMNDLLGNDIDQIRFNSSGLSRAVC